jgi:hypothetical protein
MSRLRPVLNVHPLGNYSFGNSPPRAEGVAGSERAAKLAEAYAQSGVRRSVEGILLVNEHRHPHVLLLQARRASTGGAAQLTRPAARRTAASRCRAAS